MKRIQINYIRILAYTKERDMSSIHLITAQSKRLAPGWDRDWEADMLEMDMFWVERQKKEILESSWNWIRGFIIKG